MAADRPSKSCCCAKPQATALADEAGRESFPPSAALGKLKKDCCETTERRSVGEQRGKTHGHSG
jgi:hypothetical protein